MKKNVLIIFLLVCVLGLGGYIAYNNYNVSTKSNMDNQYLDYLKVLKNNLQKTFDEKDSEISIYSDSMIWDKGYTFTINKNFDLLMTIEEDKLKDKYTGYKLDSNVLSMYILSTGNGGFKTLYYITSDGIVKSLCIEYLENEKPKIKEEKFKNIVNITQGNFDASTTGGYVPIFIDIKGNTHTY